MLFGITTCEAILIISIACEFKQKRRTIGMEPGGLVEDDTTHESVVF